VSQASRQGSIDNNPSLLRGTLKAKSWLRIPGRKRGKNKVKTNPNPSPDPYDLNPDPKRRKIEDVYVDSEIGDKEGGGVINDTLEGEGVGGKEKEGEKEGEQEEEQEEEQKEKGEQEGEQEGGDKELDLRGPIVDFLGNEIEPQMEGEVGKSRG
jgi:hypothetical protein